MPAVSTSVDLGACYVNMLAAAELTAVGTLLHDRASSSELCGRILMFLTRLLPLLDRSGLNVQGQFNTAHSTPVEDVPEVRCHTQLESRPRVLFSCAPLLARLHCLACAPNRAMGGAMQRMRNAASRNALLE